MNPRRPVLLARIAGLLLVCANCSNRRASTAVAEPAQLGASAVACPGHAACADHFVVDDVAPAHCSAGAVCAVSWKLVPGGEFHLNEEYPYRFKADEVSGVAFNGNDPAGKNVFSKSAGDWRKDDGNAGVMTVRFTPGERGHKTVSGVLKLSVCSPQNCLLDQRRLSASLDVE